MVKGAELSSCCKRVSHLGLEEENRLSQEGQEYLSLDLTAQDPVVRCMLPCVNRVAALRSTPLVSVARFDHPDEEAHRDPDEERAGGFSVSFVENGRFHLIVGRERYTLDRWTLFLTRPGLVFRCVHEAELPDDVCISVEFAPAFAEEIVAAAPDFREKGLPVIPLTNRLGFLRLALIDEVECVSGLLAAEVLAGELLGVALGPGGGSRLFRRSQLAWYAKRIRLARERIEADYAERHTLRDLARDAGMSPYHFARVFGELVGKPPHRYLRDVRLCRAAADLDEGASVTEACSASGFQNLSHFIRSFRRAYGVSPSCYSTKLRC